jgi:transposase InsO family protein
VVELTGMVGSQRQALELVGLSRSTWHYRHHPRPRVADPVPHTDRAYPCRISDADRARISERINAAWARSHSVDYAFATAWDEGIMLAARRSWWRIAASIPDQSRRPVAPTRSTQGTRTPRSAPVLIATRPNDVWTWDITDLRTPWRGVAFKAYCAIDIYSRYIVGWRVEEREVDDLAVDMFERAFSEYGIPGAVHADSGPSMRSNAVADLLGDLGIAQTHNRPRVSDDNPFSESEFRTMKYRPNYPGVFATLDQARAYLEWYVPWYNTQHRHSGIALFTPQQVFDGTWQGQWLQRHHTQQAYYAAHPDRFRRPPATPAPAPIVGINMPKPDHQNQAA